MDQDARLQRREAARQAVRRRRRLALAFVLGAAALVLVVVVLAGGLLNGSNDDTRAAAESRSEPPKLPRGGRSLFPERRVVAFYGAPQSPELGTLGIGSPQRAARRLERLARAYAQPSRPVLPAFELIATIVQSDPGDNGDHAARQEPRTIARYLRTARRNEMLLILDVQPGYASFIDEVRALERFLREPDVSVALDPEWSMEPPALPGQEIGSTDAATVNEVSAYLSRIVRRHRLPEKLLVVHRFTDEMVENEADLKQYPGVALTVNVDGFGDRPNKVSRYRGFTRGRRGRPHGFKLFYEEDINLMPPKRVLRLRPAPDLVVYE
ncbi:MAG: hypothetical protein M3550_11585 [Actinomycetota bacterium]|nr:hypothetical protein [Actinomycetota bacterium]